MQTNQHSSQNLDQGLHQDSSQSTSLHQSSSIKIAGSTQSAASDPVSKTGHSTKPQIDTFTEPPPQKVSLEAAPPIEVCSKMPPHEFPVDLAEQWLSWQCRAISGIIRGAIYFPSEQGSISSAIAVWPTKGDVESQLLIVANEALADSQPVERAKLAYGPKNNRTCDVVACPLLVDKKLVAVVSVMMSARSESQRQVVLRILTWGGQWIKTLLQQVVETQQKNNIFSLTLATVVLRHSSSQVAAIDMANRLADQFGCERVSIGFRQGLPIRLQALSHVATFDGRTQLVRKIEAAMEESVDQVSLIVLPDESKSNSVIDRAHVELANGGAISTHPLPGRRGFIGAITFERGSNQPFTEDELIICQRLVQFIGPALELKQLDERSVWSKGAEDILRRVSTVFGKAYLKLKIVLAVIMVLMIAAAVFDGDYKITAPASVESSIRQVLVAPQNGYVKESLVQAGDLVKKDQLMALLDDRNLQLELRKWQSERNKIEKVYQEALAKHDRIELGIQSAQLQQVNAELLLVKEKIAHTQLRAPFDGVVINGDLTQSLGAPVEIGQTLFEVAPLDSYQVVLEVDDHNMAGLKAGITGKLIIAALPNDSFSVSINQVIPIAISKGSRNFFRVEASLAEHQSQLLPGMRGVAKLEMGERKILWIWTHSLIDRLRLWLWSVGL